MCRLACADNGRSSRSFVIARAGTEPFAGALCLHAVSNDAHGALGSGRLLKTSVNQAPGLVSGAELR